MAKLVLPREETALTEAWRIQLAELLGSGSQKVVLVGVGNPQRGDDDVGNYIVNAIMDSINPSRLRDTYLFDAENNVESLITRIHDLGPNHVIFVDACQMGLKPGAVNLLAIEDTSYSFFATHGIPLKVLAERMLSESKVWILAIQPQRTDFGEELSQQVRDSASSITRAITSSLKNGGRLILD